MKTDTPWIVVSRVEGEHGVCLLCGQVLRLQLPMLLDDTVAMMMEFVEQHRHCPEELKV